MSRTNFEPCMAEVKIHEGGYVNHRKDPGGETNWGISKRSYPRLDIKSLTWEDAKRIYRHDFWQKIQGDVLPTGVDYVVLDPAINSGPSRAIKFLQAAAKVPADGKLGSQTLNAVLNADPVNLILSISKQRLGFMKGLKTWMTFKNGWSTRVASVEARAVRMAGAGPQRMLFIADSARRKADQQTRQNFLTAGGGGAATVGAQGNLWIIATIAVVGVVVLIAIAGSRRHELNRAAAYAKELNNV